MQVAVSSVARAVDEDSFADLTPVRVLSVNRVGSGVVIDFDGDVSADVRAAVVKRCMSSVDADDLRTRALSDLAACDAYLASPAPTAAETVAQVRLLTRLLVSVVRLVLRRL